MNADIFLGLTLAERKELLDEGALQRGLSPIVLEKDFWVCLTLDCLFSLPEISDHLVFKGGTSLSKVYGLIQRFSEDVDVSIHRDTLGFAGPEDDPEQATGIKEQKRRLERLRVACESYIRQRLQPALQKALTEKIGTAKGWSLRVDEQDPQTLLFVYPRSELSVSAYIQPMVRIELGARSDHWPAETHGVRSYVADMFDLAEGSSTVKALAAERTFWEKATLLHAECHRDPTVPQPSRITRHYHDMASLAQSDVAHKALQDVALRERVVLHKSIYFRSGWARYDLCLPGSFRLIPPDERLSELEHDHQAMQSMFFSKSLSLNQVMKIISVLENQINQPD